MALDQDKRTILTQYLQAEYSVARALAEATSLPEAARLVLQALCQSLDWSFGAVWIVDEDERLITCLEVFQSPTGNFPDFINATRTMRFEPGIGLPGRVWAQGSPAWITDTLKDDNFPRIKVAAKDGLHGAVGFPILLGTQVFGVIELLSTEIRQPDPDLLATMTTICSQVAQFVKRDQAQQQLQQRIDHLQSIYQINDAVTRADAQETIYQEALSGIQSALHTERASILLFDPDGVMRFKAWRGLSDDYRQATEGHTPWRPDTPNPVPVIVENVDEDTTLGEPLKQTVLTEGIRALAFFPLVHQGRVAGKFMVYYDQPHDFSISEIQLALVIAGHIAFAIERSRADSELRRQQQQLTDFIENAVIGMHWVGPDGTILWANQAELDMLGFTREEYFGHNIAEFHADADVISNILRGLSNNETLQAYEARLRCKDGSIKYVLIDSNVLWEDGKFVHMRCFTRDITPRKRSEQALQKAIEFHHRLEAQLTSLVEASGTLLGSLSVETVLDMTLHISQQLIAADAYAVWRYRPATQNWRVEASSGLSEAYQQQNIDGYGSTLPADGLLLAENIADVPQLAKRLPMYAAEHIQSLLIVPLRIHGVVSGTFAFYYHEPRRFNEVEVRVATAMANIVASALGSADLYEEQRQLRAQAQQAEQRAALLAEASAIMAESFDYESALKALSHIFVPRLADWCAVYLLADDNSIAIADLAASTPELSARLELLRGFPFDINGNSISSQVLRTGESHFISEREGAEVASRAVNPEHVEIVRSLNITSGLCVAIRGRDRILGAISLSMSNSNRRFTPQDLGFIEELARRAAIAIDNARLYREAQQARTEAEAAVRLRDEFLSIAAHELRTPVTSLRGFAQTLIRQLERNSALDPVQVRRALDTIDKQSVKLASLVSRLLDISRIEAGRLEVERKPTDVAALARELVAQAQTTTTRHALTLHAPPTLDAYVDPIRIEQVISNLVDNAIKYSPDGGPIDVVLDTSASDHVCLSVTDHGIGIPPEQRERIFARFYQAHASSSFGGMGLGLYISRQIVKLHGGQIEARFPADGGTSFVVTLPVLPVPSSEGPISESSSVPRTG